MGLRDITHGERDPGGFRPKVLPPVWATIIAAAMYALARWRGDAALVGTETVGPQWVAIALLLGGVALSTWAGWGFASKGTPIEPGRVSTELLTGGPYRFSRNPIYVGMAISLAGWALWLGDVCALVGPLLFLVIVYLRIVRHEERMLAERFGDDYASYRSRVRRWL